MTPATIQNFTHVAGKQQGYLPLPIRVSQVLCPVQNAVVPQFEQAWKPSEDELAMLNAGGVIVISQHCHAVPPTVVSVEEPSEVDVTDPRAAN